MTREEFAELAVVDGAEISIYLFEAIDGFYMSDSLYHQQHGGIEESKQDFVVRVFGGKVNSLDDIVAKITAEAVKENRWALRGNLSAPEPRLVEMDTLIADHYRTVLTM